MFVYLLQSICHYCLRMRSPASISFLRFKFSVAKQQRTISNRAIIWIRCLMYTIYSYIIFTLGKNLYDTLPSTRGICQFSCMRTTNAQIRLRMRRLISVFDIRFLESIKAKHAISKISLFKLVSVAEQTGL